jgi:hypothetical protein
MISRKTTHKATVKRLSILPPVVLKRLLQFPATCLTIFSMPLALLACKFQPSGSESLATSATQGLPPRLEGQAVIYRDESCSYLHQFSQNERTDIVSCGTNGTIALTYNIRVENGPDGTNIRATAVKNSSCPNPQGQLPQPFSIFIGPPMGEQYQLSSRFDPEGNRQNFLTFSPFSPANFNTYLEQAGCIASVQAPPRG